jgi:peptide/nickel transport system ATP-binding protein
MLEIRDLSLVFESEEGPSLDLFNSLSLDLSNKEMLGIVGESGSGKSTLAYAITGLLPSNAKITSGEITFEGRQLLRLSEGEMKTVRGKIITMVFQDPSTALNPVFRIRDQILAVIKKNTGLEGIPARQHAVQLLREVELPDPAEVMDSFPFELSGGMQQRVMIAMALSSNPRLIIADEPTSSVDATIQEQILHLFRRLKTERDFSMIIITHSIAVAQEVCDRIAVMYAGDIVEEGPAGKVVSSPSHPYSEALVKSIPHPREGSHRKADLAVVPGQVPDLRNPPSGCRFHPRCPYLMDVCVGGKPPYYSANGVRALCYLYEGSN